MGASNSNKMAEEQPQRNDVAKFALEMAKIAEQAERYEDMVAEMKKIVDDGVKGDELSVEERNLISVGYKNMMSVRRTAWRTIQQVEEEEARKNSTEGAAANLAAYKQNIASEVFDLIDQVCANIVKVYTDESSPLKATKEEVLVFFLKMEGDYYRYGAEITDKDARDDYKKKAHESYKKAQTLAEGLKETNPIRLGLALNYSVSTMSSATRRRRHLSWHRPHSTRPLTNWTPLARTPTGIALSSCSSSRTTSASGMKHKRQTRRPLELISGL